MAYVSWIELLELDRAIGVGYTRTFQPKSQITIKQLHQLTYKLQQNEILNLKELSVRYYLKISKWCFYGMKNVQARFYLILHHFASLLCQLVFKMFKIHLHLLMKYLKKHPSALIIQIQYRGCRGLLRYTSSLLKVQCNG